MAHIKLRHKGRVTPHRGLTPTCMRWHTDISTYFLAHTSTGKTFCYWYWIGRFLSCPTCWHPSEWGQKACSWGKLLGKTNYSEIRNLFRNPWCGRSSPMSVCDHFLARKAFQFHSPLVSHSSHNCQRHSSAPCSSVKRERASPEGLDS